MYCVMSVLSVSFGQQNNILILVKYLLAKIGLSNLILVTTASPSTGDKRPIRNSMTDILIKLMIFQLWLSRADWKV